MPLERESSRVHDIEDDDADGGARTSANNREIKRRRLEGGKYYFKLIV
jgi:hypothetical protein